MLLMVWHVLVPGTQTVTVTFGMFTKFCAPGPTVMGTVFAAVAAIGCAVGPPLMGLVLPELPPEPLPEPLPELPPESPPPPQAARRIDRVRTASQRSR